MNLSEAIGKVLAQAGGPLGVGDIAQRVAAAGYRSGSANFRGIVNQTLVKHTRFVSERRGEYRLRSPGRTRTKTQTKRGGARGKGRVSERPSRAWGPAPTAATANLDLPALRGHAPILC